MKSARYIYIILVALLCSISTYAQGVGSALKFTAPSYDFGHIKEEGGEVQCLFTATNISENEIYVVNITTSCGCTTTSYSKEAIAPHATFELTVKFNPYNRPGRIDKHIFVTASDSNEPICLTIEGFVQERERTVDELYPFDMGEGLRLRSNFHAFGYIEQGDISKEHIGFINTSNQPLQIGVEFIKQSGLLAIEYPTTIPAGATGDITLCYTVPHMGDIYGTVEDRMRIDINGTEARYTLSSEAIITDNFSMVDDISAPRGDISKKIIKFGEINCINGYLEQEVIVTNIGASPLEVRAIESSSEAVECEASSRTLQPNESATLHIRLNTKDVGLTEGVFTARVRIVTNDPIRPMQTIKVNAIID